jgi:hypothetical protein
MHLEHTKRKSEPTANFDYDTTNASRKNAREEHELEKKNMDKN